MLDHTTDHVPAADVLLCRDALVHLSFADIRSAMTNIARSDVTYLLGRYRDKSRGLWRVSDLRAAGIVSA